MSRDDFKFLLDQHKIFYEYSHNYYKIGLDFYESDYPITIPFEKMFDKILEIHYNEFGLDWIYWFIFETEYGSKELEAYDSDMTLICQTVDGLYDYIEQYRNNNG